MSADTLTKAGSTGPLDAVTGPRTPVVSHSPAASSGALAASTTRTRMPRPAGRRQPPSPNWPGSTSAATTPASTRPAAATASAIPGQAATGRNAPSGVTSTRLTATAMNRPSSATAQPASTSERRAVRSSAASAARTRPPVTQNGGSPGPPGDSSSNDRAGRPAVARPGTFWPASRNSSAGWLASCTVQGSSSSGGTSTAIPRLMARPRRPRPPCQPGLRAAPASAAAATAMTQVSGTNAVATARNRPVAQAARRARRPGAVKIRAASMPISGISANTTAAPNRPAATAPMPTGSSA